MDNFKIKFQDKLSELGHHLLEWLKRLWVKIRRTWKKYHVTKVFILAVLSVALFFSVYLSTLAKQADVDSLRLGLEQTTTVIDDQGEQAGTLYSQKGTFVPIENISTNIQDAIISTEDQRFMRHRGFDPIGIGRAAVGYVVQGGIVGGGSTITQQLAKNAYLTADQTMIRKLRELFLAIEIEKTYPKDTILEMYLNNSYFGQGVWGVQDASLKYFNKNASEINLSEAATLAGMLKAPSNYNPIDNYEAAISRRNVVLSLMEETEAITPEERTTAVNSDLQLVDGYNAQDDYRYPYYFDAVITEAINKYGFDEQVILNGGYRIYTNLNQNHQKQMDAVYDKDYLFETAGDGKLAQSASISIQPQTGGITAVVGGRGDYVFRGLNRATQRQARRQPGSVLKPIGVYPAALEAGYSIDSILEDEQQAFGELANGEPYIPENVDKTYEGEVPMYEALAQSKNTASVWLLNEIGLNRGYNKLKDFGIEMTEGDNNLQAVALGGMEYGTTPLDIASAYTVFANDGVQVEPHFITKIVDPTGAVVVDNTAPKSKRVLSKQVNDDMNRMLLNVFANGNAQSIQPANFEIAGKTGTTQTEHGAGVKDQWVVGYTPDLVVASWQGFDPTDETHYLRSWTPSGIGQVAKAEFETMLPYTTGTQFAVDETDIEVIVRDNTRNEVIDNIRNGLESTGNVIRDVTGRAVEGAKNIFDSFFNNR